MGVWDYLGKKLSYIINPHAYILGLVCEFKEVYWRVEQVLWVEVETPLDCGAKGIIMW